MKKTNHNILPMAVLAIVVIGILVALALQNSPRPATTITSGTQLLLNEQDLQQLEMASNGTDCETEEYQTGEYSPLAQYSICYYDINSLNDTQVIIEVKKFTNLNDLNGTYQYESVHLRSIKGLLSENDFGDQSRFYVNNEDDYGGQFNPPGVYYYALYVCKNEYLIHISSSGRSREAVDNVAEIGRQILSKFE